jgi:propionyl-CoA synthetase
MNTSYNALDVHVAMGNGDKVALRYDSPLSDTKRSLTYKELLEQGALLFVLPWPCHSQL